MPSSRATGRDPGPLEITFTLGPMKLDGNDRSLIRPNSRYFLLSEVYGQKNSTPTDFAQQVFDGQSKWQFLVSGLPTATDTSDGVVRCDEQCALRLSLYEEGQLGIADVSFEDVKIGTYITMTPNGCSAADKHRYVGKVVGLSQDAVKILWNDWQWGGPIDSLGIPKEREEPRSWWQKGKGRPTTAVGEVQQRVCVRSQRIRLGGKDLDKEIVAKALKFQWRSLVTAAPTRRSTHWSVCGSASAIRSGRSGLRAEGAGRAGRTSSWWCIRRPRRRAADSTTRTGI